MAYLYGLFLNPQPCVPCLPTQQEAEQAARKMSLDNLGAPVAVWDETGNTVTLFAGHEVFKPCEVAAPNRQHSL